MRLYGTSLCFIFSQSNAVNFFEGYSFPNVERNLKRTCCWKSCEGLRHGQKKSVTVSYISLTLVTYNNLFLLRQRQRYAQISSSGNIAEDFRHILRNADCRPLETISLAPFGTFNTNSSLKLVIFSVTRKAKQRQN